MISATILAFPRSGRNKPASQDKQRQPCEIIPFTGVYRMRIPDDDFLIATSPPVKRRAGSRRKVRRSST
jgi:hypothetical protein